MTDLWIVLTTVAGVVLVVDLVMTQWRKRARHITFTRQSTKKEAEPDAHEG